MTISTMKNKLKNALQLLLIAVFWIGVWDVAALLIKKPVILPSPLDTGLALFELLATGEFYAVVLATLLRVTLGLALGIVLGIALALLCHKFSMVKTFLSPVISVIRSTPVASFIVLLWVMLSGDMLTIIVAFLMVMPIVWQNTLDGFASIPKELIEVARDKKNSAAVGIAGKIRDAIENFFLAEPANATDPSTAFFHLSTGYSEGVDYSYLWSLEQYKTTVHQEEQSDDWDELEKSVIASVADDVIVGVKGKQADIIIVKKFA